MAHRLLHGTLHATILEADNLTNPDRATGGAPQIIRKLVEGFEETIGRGKGSTQLYATVDLGRARVGRTRVIAGDPVNPRWYEDFHIYCAHFAADVVFTVKAAQPISATLIGRAYLPVRDLLDADGSEIERRLDVLDASKEKLPHGPTILVRLRFCDVTADRRHWGAGLCSARHPGVPYTFFPQRPGCRVTLYQDAHTPDAFAPRIPLSGGRTYQQGRCWEDVFDAISDARHLVYVAGWSVYTEITLIRDGARPRPGGDATLGELLKRKAGEGVRVLMLVWDDRTSVESLGMTWGYMKTHDAVTAGYFRGTDVQCVLCPRNPDAGRSAAMGFETAYMISHHQKVVAVDHDMPVRGNSSSRRRIVSFVGGLDLCDGRYDTQFHSLFRTLDTAHRKDFRQANLHDASISQGGPREPWHDIHARIEGPAAWDILYNFEQRWRKQGGDNDLLVDLRAMANLIIPPSAVTFPDDDEAWNVQVFRSIDGGASFGFPSAPEEAARSGLVSGKNNTIDRSIQDAYIRAIRRAKHFIYIENQYFLGSSFAWKAGDDDIRPEEIGALHLIPRELSLKIVSKIEAGEHFVVYVVVPMWPEGPPEPEGGSMQAILDWQRRTMDMMYRDIAVALEAKGIEAANPKDYLTFFCLGNREVKRSGEYEPADRLLPGSNYERAQNARRFMIYVHSKMMIVDDEYIIVGSANINQRSMDGGRDSEIAIGAFQPHRLNAGGQVARGQIHGFRMSLWYEHLGMLHDDFLSPGSLECVRRVNEMADKYWELYAGDELNDDLPGHLLTYPVAVTKDGTVTELPGARCFPDTQAPVLGAKSDLLPHILTT